MEAVGAAAAVIQLVDLALRIGFTCQQFYFGVKDARKDIQRVTDEVTSLADILQQLQDILDSPSGSTPTVSDLLNKPDGPLQTCYTELSGLKEKLDSASSGKLRSLVWPIREKEVTKLVAIIERQKSALELALTVGNTAVGLYTSDNVQQLRNDIAAAQSDEKRKEILRWLTVTDPSSNHISARSKHEKSTGEWLLNGSRFEKWKLEPNTALWLHGKAGCGKSILCSTIIDQIQSLCHLDPNKALAYFYFDFNDSEKQNTRNLIKSLIVQLCRQRHDLPQSLQYLYQKCHDGNHHPTFDDLKSILLISTDAFEHVYIVIDALDECPAGNDERERLLDLLREIHSWSREEIHLLVTSRREIDIDEALLEILTRRMETPISLQDDLHDEDIRLHISKQLMSPKFKSWPKKVKDEVESALGQEVDGMFRWVSCQLDLLQTLSQASKIRKALKSLPKTLDATYDRMLNSIDEESREQALLALQWLTFSARPISVAELAEAIIINPREIPPFDFDDRLFNPTQILRFLPGLVTITSTLWHYDGRSEIKLAHSSVKEYLVSSRINEGPAKDFHIRQDDANLIIAETCLSYHLHASADILYIVNALLDYPLAEYAAQYWAHHARHIDSSSWGSDMDRLCLELLGQRDRSLLNLIRVADPDREEWKTPDYGKMLEDLAPQLYYAAASGVPQAANLLLGKGMDINAIGGRYCNAMNVACRGGYEKVVELLHHKGVSINQDTTCGSPLQIAACQGHESVVRLLLNNGADVKSIGNAFQIAVDNGYQGVVQLLKDKGAQAATQPSYNDALLKASKNGEEQTVRDLLKNGADVNVQNGTDGTPLQMAAEAGHANVVRILLENSASVNHVGEYYYGTALQGAARYGHEAVVRLLIENDAEVDAYSGEYGSPLQAASRDGHVEIVRILLDNGADVNGQGGRYGTALIAASRTGQEAVVELLLKNGAKIEVSGAGRYNSAVDAAKEDGNKKVVRLLTTAMSHVAITA